MILKFDIDYENDRIILVILEHMQPLAIRDRRKLKKLTNRYADNHVYRDEIIKKLVFAGYLICECDKETTESGFILESNHRYYTSDIGRNALKHGRFISEYKTQKLSVFNRRLSLASISIGIFGGLMGLSTTIYQACTNTNGAQKQIKAIKMEIDSTSIKTNDTDAIVRNISDTCSLKYSKSAQ